jgi:hypothetical protein
MYSTCQDVEQALLGPTKTVSSPDAACGGRVRAARAHLYLRRQPRGLLAQLRVLRPQRRLARRAPAPGVLRAPQQWLFYSLNV